MKALSLDQVFLIYKFLETPLQTLIDTISAKSEDDIKKYYRNMAKILHPDKNCHPRSNEAFQKIQSAVDFLNK